ncbi:MAG: pentapeptide repeat-containing protein, partial [Chloroflexi bacterium]|nr:pentapeptide repeat-containing protein [Chloroflexota bacterium]
MANEEQLAILKQGVDVWNQWREKYPDVVIDLKEANLEGA